MQKCNGAMGFEGRRLAAGINVDGSDGEFIFTWPKHRQLTVSRLPIFRADPLPTLLNYPDSHASGAVPDGFEEGADMKQEFILTQAGAKYQVKKKPMAGNMGHVLMTFSINGPDEPVLPADTATVNELLVWAGGLVSSGYEFER